MAELSAENEQLKAQVAKLGRIPLKEHTRKGVAGESHYVPGATGNKRLDALNKYLKK